MTKPDHSSQNFYSLCSEVFSRHLSTILGCLLLSVIGVFVYRNAFAGPFVFDDIAQILQNPKVLTLTWPWQFLINNRRPMLYLSLALDFHRYGFNAFEFHAFNIRVHILASIFLFLNVRLTLSLIPHMRTVWTDVQRNLVALSAAVLWLVHPLQTQAVTYIIQRAESLMGLFFLMSLFCSIRYLLSKSWLWLCAAGLTGLLCGLTKEVALALPIVVLLYDRAFISHTIKSAMLRHHWLYAAMAAIWSVMLFLYFTTRPEEKLTAGFGMVGITPLKYLSNQPAVILHYLQLALWPNPLVFDYGWPICSPLAALMPSIFAMGVIGVILLLLDRISPCLSFPGMAFFVILFPSSSFIPLQDLAFEYRMYLSLSLVAVVFSALCFWLISSSVPFHRRSTVFVVIIGVVSLMMGGVTYQRNQVYRSEEWIWRDVIKKRPENARAFNNLGEYYLRVGRDQDAKMNFLKSIALSQQYADVFGNMATVLGKEGQYEQAIYFARRAIEINPDFAIAYNNLGSALSQSGRYKEAVPYFQKTLQLGFKEPGVLMNLGVALVNSGRTQEALKALHEALRLDPDSQAVKDVLRQINEHTRDKKK